MRIVKHLRSHAVAYVALFFALGGTSMAAVQSLPKNSVGTKQLKKNAVISTKVKNNALTGADILESSLAKVPSAVHADSADSATSANSATNATNATNAANAANAGHATTADTATNASALQGHGPSDFVGSGDYKRVLVKMQLGDEKEIVRNGPVSVYARCVTAGGGFDQLQIYAKTDVDGALLMTDWGDVLAGPSEGGFLDTATPEANREWDNSNTSPTDQSSAAAPAGETKVVQRYDNNYLIAPSGEAIGWEGESELFAFNYLGARCLIAGDVHLFKLG